MKVTVITPSYNQGVFIEATLASVAMQRGVELEHWVFDGGSCDETVAVLQRHPSVQWVSEKDDGQADAVNKGIAATDGEVIGWLNSDDIYYEDAIASAVAFLAAHPDVDVVYGMADHMDRAGQPIEAYPTEPWDFARLREVCFICQPAVFLRRSVVQRYGLLDASLRYCMDYEYWLRLAQQGARFAYLPQKLAASRLYAGNKTLGARVAVHREINGMLARRLGRVPDRWLFNYAHALTDTHRDRIREPRRYRFELAWRSLSAALRWNRTISADMLRTFARGAARSA